MDDIEDWMQSLNEEVGVPEFTSHGVELVVSIAEEQLKVERQIAMLEMLLSEMKKALRQLQWEKLPDAMDEADLSSFTMKDGSTIGIKDYLHCDLGKMEDDQRTRMYDWLVTNKHDNIIRTSLQYDLDRGKFALAQKVREFVEKEFGILGPLGHKVHWQTLDKWAREMKERGEMFPEDTFNCNIGRRAIIKRK